jgi:hypothetical protein
MMVELRRDVIQSCLVLVSSLFVLLAISACGDTAPPEHHPQLVIPTDVPSLSTQMPRIRPEDLSRIATALPIPTCTVGKKYGAVCQDGTWSLDTSEETCSGHGGVRAWIECQ